jgi:shikimate kinase
MLVFLNGFMGSGKTHWGKIWATTYRLGFIDVDEDIEIDEQKKITEIFEQKGEAYFRQLETAKLQSYGTLTNTIIACGGGTPCFADNMQWMNAHGTTVYLTSTPDEILRRLIKAQQNRPLINDLNQAELLFFIQQKLKERQPFYTQAQISIPTNELTEEIFVEKIITL